MIANPNQKLFQDFQAAGLIQKARMGKAPNISGNNDIKINLPFFKGYDAKATAAKAFGYNPT